MIPLTWGLNEVMQFAEVLLNKDDIDAKADAFIDFLQERVIGREFHEAPLSTPHRVRSFGELETFFRDLLRGLEERGGESWRTHHVATIRKVRNRLSNISTRCAGLVTDEGSVSDLPFGSFQDRTVYVVDVASLEENAQDLIFARVVSKLREHLERRDLGVSQVVVFVDELNKYAPGDGPETYVRKMLLDISERGRYLGLVLFSAQQFRSQVHRRVVGNAGTSLYGRMDMDELATPGYAVLSAATRTKLATLEKGQLMVRHPHFAQPIFVRFPRPAVLRGRDGAERFPQAQEVGDRRRGAALAPPAGSVALARLGQAHDRGSRRGVGDSRAQRDAPAAPRACGGVLRGAVPARGAGGAAAIVATVAGCDPVASGRRPLRILMVPSRLRWSLALLALCAAEARAQRLMLELRPRVGDTLRMRLDQTTELIAARRGGTPRSVTTTLVMFSRAIVEASAQASTLILAVTDSANVDTDDERSRTIADETRRLLAGRQMRLRLSPDGTVAVAEHERSVPREVNDLVAVMPASFPRGSVAVGDTWMREMPDPAVDRARRAPGWGGEGGVPLRFGVERGETAYLTMRGTLEPSTVAAAMTEKGTLTGTVNGNMTVDRRRGWLSESRFLIQMKATVTSLGVARASTPMEIRMTITQHMKVFAKR